MWEDETEELIVTWMLIFMVFGLVVAGVDGVAGWVDRRYGTHWQDTIREKIKLPDSSPAPNAPQKTPAPQKTSKPQKTTATSLPVSGTTSIVISGPRSGDVYS